MKEGAASAALSLSEREKYAKVWDHPRYAEHSPGLRHLPEAMRWMKPPKGSSITDWGSGSGQASDEMHRKGFAVRMVDIAANAYKGDNDIPYVEACLWELPEMPPTQYGYCADVMEHIPPEQVDAVLAGIAKHTQVACYFQIALFHDHFGDCIGESLHLSVFPPAWWHERILKAFATAEFKGIGQRHVLAVARV